VNGLISKMQFEDWVEFLFNFGPMAGALFLVSVVLVASVFFTTTRAFWRWSLVILAPLWFVFIVSSFKRTLILTALDSEWRGVAEYAYVHNFDAELDQSIDLLVWSRRENIRFYAACRVADLLVLQNETTASNVLSELENAPLVTPEFHGTNSINGIFYTGMFQPRLRVDDLIRQRMEQGRNRKSL
jgi:hypothetical protein